jgi:hypothetical protein
MKLIWALMKDGYSLAEIHRRQGAFDLRYIDPTSEAAHIYYSIPGKSFFQHHSAIKVI